MISTSQLTVLFIKQLLNNRSDEAQTLYSNIVWIACIQYSCLLDFVYSDDDFDLLESCLKESGIKAVGAGKGESKTVKQEKKPEESKEVSPEETAKEEDVGEEAKSCKEVEEFYMCDTI